MGEPLLRVEELRAVYQGIIVAVRDVSLVVSRGDVVLLLGANGAGKTTTLKAISNLLAAEGGSLAQGRILYEGRDTAGRQAWQLVRGGIAQVLEGRHCFGSLTIEENLRTGAQARGGTRAERRADLDRVYAMFPRLRDKRDVPAALTSGGEQQMAAIGRALMSRPQLLLLDEPSMGLAPAVSDELFRSLEQLNADGLTILLAEQGAAAALAIAHDAYVLDHGVVALHEQPVMLQRRGALASLYMNHALSMVNTPNN